MFKKIGFAGLLLASNITIAQVTLKVGTGATLKTTGGAVVTLNDVNLENDGTIDQGTGEGVFRFTGIANNTISGTGTTVFDQLQIGKTGSAKILLNRQLTIGGTVSFTTGFLDLNGNNIILNAGAVLNGESIAGRVIGTSGYVQVVENLNAPAGANPGNLGAIITSAANLGTTTIRRGHASQTNGSGIGSSILRYFDIAPANNSGLNATLSINYEEPELNNLAEDNLVLWSSSNLVQWTNQGFTTRDPSLNFVEKTGLTSFSRWTLSSPNNALPVQFLLFNVKCSETSGTVAVNWKTTREVNVQHFQVQRSSNGLSWATIGLVPANGGFSTEQNYSFTDQDPLASGAQYRIVSYDLNGEVQYTHILRISCGAKEWITAGPNPVRDRLNVNISVITGTRVNVSVIDAKGALYRRQQINLLAGSNQFAIDMSNLPSGNYQVSIESDGNFRKTLTVIK